jgi:hypothetical protein
MDAIVEFQRSLGGPVLALLRSYWMVPLLLVTAGAWWMFVGNPFEGRDTGGADVDLGIDVEGDSGDGGGGDGGGD